MVTKVRLSEAGVWKDTVTGVGIGDTLYSVERDGSLHSTSNRGNTTLGTGYRTKLLLADGTDEGNLYAVERNGNLYKVDPEDGTWTMMGEPGGWSDVVAADAVDGWIYFVDTDGDLTAVNPESGDFHELGGNYDTRSLWYFQEHVYILENDGSLYKVHAETGEYERFGSEGAYSDTTTATLHDRKFFAVEDDGALGVTSLDDSSYEELTDEDLSNVRHLFSAGEHLYAIEKDGTLYRLDLD